MVPLRHSCLSTRWRTDKKSLQSLALVHNLTRIRHHAQVKIVPRNWKCRRRKLLRQQQAPRRSWNRLDLLESFRRDEGETGPLINENVAKMVNDLWAKERNPKIIKTLYEQHPTPENTLKMGKVDLNEEVISAIPKHVRARDLKIQAIQGVMARAAVKIVDSLYAKKEVMKQEHINMAIDCLSLVASANASVNQLRRDMIRPSLARKYQLLCISVPKPLSKLLLGDNLADRVKQVNTTSSLMTQGIGTGRQLPGDATTHMHQCQDLTSMATSHMGTSPTWCQESRANTDQGAEVF